MPPEAVVSAPVADVASGCSVEVLPGACVVGRLAVVASDVAVVLEVVVTRGVAAVVLVVVLVLVVVVVLVVGGIVVVLGRTGQDRQDKSRVGSRHCSRSSVRLGRGHSPTAQRLMSGPSSMPSGQAQVYLGEWSVICGAFRQRYSQPPLGRLPMLQASGAGGTEAESAEDPTGLPVTLEPFKAAASP